eukprot:3944911-Pleurochrysis_carterae.AAC.1
MSPSGRVSAAPVPDAPAFPWAAASALGRPLRALARGQRPSLAAGCGARRSPGMGSPSSTSGASGC